MAVPAAAAGNFLPVGSHCDARATNAGMPLVPRPLLGVNLPSAVPGPVKLGSVAAALGAAYAMSPPAIPNFGLAGVPPSPATALAVAALAVAALAAASAAGHPLLGEGGSLARQQPEAIAREAGLMLVVPVAAAAGAAWYVGAGLGPVKSAAVVAAAAVGALAAADYALSA